MVSELPADEPVAIRLADPAHSLAGRERDPRSRHGVDLRAAALSAAATVSADDMAALAALGSATETDVATAQEVVSATIANGGADYVLDDTVTLPDGVVVKATIVTGGVIEEVVLVAPGSTTTPPTNPVAQVSTSGTGTGAEFNLFWAPVTELPTFPTFTPIIPTSTFPPGGGVGSIGDPEGVPTFPPPTPPPIGHVPAGPLVGPAVADAPVPPSLAGVAQPQYETGSATVPPANGYFPEFTTTTAYAGFPNQPPDGVPIVFANIWTVPELSGDVWTDVVPPSTPTVAQITLGGWGLPGPSGSGPGPPTYPNPPGAGLNDVGAIRLGHAEPAERSAGSVLSRDDTTHLHQPEPPQDRGGKRMSSRHSTRRPHST